MIYDVLPVEPRTGASARLTARVVDHPLGKVLMPRGATNKKGAERAFLNVLEPIIATRGKLPVNLAMRGCGNETLRLERRVHAAFFFGRPFPRLTSTPVPLAALVVFAEPPGPSAG
jgi:hypothetical protein